jgi:hypothetical protein
MSGSPTETFSKAKSASIDNRVSASSAGVLELSILGYTRQAQANPGCRWRIPLLFDKSWDTQVLWEVPIRAKTRDGGPWSCQGRESIHPRDDDCNALLRVWNECTSNQGLGLQVSIAVFKFTSIARKGGTGPL